MTLPLTVSIHNFVNNLDSQIAQCSDALGLSVIEMLVLHELYRADGRMPTDLALAVGKVPTSFTPILDRLQDAELIYRKPHPEDRRAILIHLTNKGKALRKEIVGHIDVTETRLREALLARIKQPMSPNLEALFAPLPEPNL